MADKVSIPVSFDGHGYVARAPELSSPVVALSLSSLRKRIEAMLPGRRDDGRRVPDLAQSPRPRAVRSEDDRMRELLDRDFLVLLVISVLAAATGFAALGLLLLHVLR